MFPPQRIRPARSAKPSKTRERFDCFAVAAPGLEPIVAEELSALGMSHGVQDGGVPFTGSLESVARANLWLRTASRVIVRVASFRAQAFHELERLARAIPWERYLASGAPVRFRVTARKSRLHHTGAIAQRLTDAVAHRLGAAPRTEPLAPPEEEADEAAAPGQLFIVRVDRDQFTVSADSSGALLHQRGYRQATGKAPLRETMAAAMLLASGWSGKSGLLDPMCGSGTIPIEGALLARRIAPGGQRHFSFLDWPEVDADMWRRLQRDAASVALASCPAAIRGSDRDAGAVAAARDNAERAGVAADVEWSVRALSAIEPCKAEEAGGLIATNPPYGVRVGEAERLRDLYARLGSVVRHQCPEWHVAILSANPRLDGQIGLPTVERLRTRNGGIPVRLLIADVPAASMSSVRRASPA